MKRPAGRAASPGRAHAASLAAVALVLACTSPGVALPPGAAPEPSTPAATPQPLAERPRDASYEVAGRQVTLVNGVASVEAAPGSASRVTTRYFGNEAAGDLDGDGVDDVALLLTQDGGGSGTFFYDAAALKRGAGYLGTNALLLGDRVAPQPTAVRNGEVIVNYADRRPGEAMTVRPSVGVSRHFRVAGVRLVER